MTNGHVHCAKCNVRVARMADGLPPPSWSERRTGKNKEIWLCQDCAAAADRQWMPNGEGDHAKRA